MKPTPNRRTFIKTIGIGSAAAVLPKNTLSATASAGPTTQNAAATGATPAKRPYNTSYTGDYLNRVAFPIGGLGAGMFCLEGSGAIAQVSIRNLPDVFNDPGMFAAIWVK